MILNNLIKEDILLNMSMEFAYNHTKETVILDIQRTFRKELTRDIRWVPETGDFYSGDVISCTVDGTTVCGNVEFDSIGLTVRMTVPYQAISYRNDVFHRHQSFFRRNPTGIRLTTDCRDDGPAAPMCIEKAHEMLMELYRDYLVMTLRSDSLHTKMAEYATFEKQFLEEERIRTEKVKERLSFLSSKSAKIKADFKAGKFKQPEYCARKAPIKEEINRLTEKLKIRDPFREYFSEDISWCFCDSHPKALIQYVAGNPFQKP